ncbi:IucA/IucC family protein [Geomicrobium sediminis]|uniref:Siderophore synthetase component n=1 Tax=Geomicrobium sediminis TaxID=1347788 RepID=A0ABS2P7K4_9BACL|nr:IucA/IucC family protein [Geomicrobium sediminis]MBM7630996.1 siderophore synthetase component [Geomicrobium sediminis]
MYENNLLKSNNRNLPEEVRDRIMRQTLEALLFEGIVSYAHTDGDWAVYGENEEGSKVIYTFKATQKHSFHRIKINPYSIKRNDETCEDLYVFLEELIQNQFHENQASSFIRELLETYAKDAQALRVQQEPQPVNSLSFDDIESLLIEGHPYHPSYKSRIGFSLEDNERYGPEFNQSIFPFWLAVHQDLVKATKLATIDWQELLDEHLPLEDQQRFIKYIEGSGQAPEEMYWIPVHPWQWENDLQPKFLQAIENHSVVLLGRSSVPYQAHQSLRSLTNRNYSESTYLKLPLNITNTSSSRILASHTIQNAAKISEWLHSIIDEDPYFKDDSFNILREVAGTAFEYKKATQIEQKQLYGNLGVIYRENINTYVNENERALPLNAVTHIQKNGVPIIQAFIDQYGAKRWLNRLIEVVSKPLMHLLYKHGIALESHAQNLIVIVEDGWPKRVVAKDLHDGVRFVPDSRFGPKNQPVLISEPEAHKKVNRYSFLEADAFTDVRDYYYDAFYFICMTEIAFFFERYMIDEEMFWKMCTNAILDYQHEVNLDQERCEAYDLFGEDIKIEQMTKRRLFGDGELYFSQVENPLLLARRQVECEPIS